MTALHFRDRIIYILYYPKLFLRTAGKNFRRHPLLLALLLSDAPLSSLFYINDRCNDITPAVACQQNCNNFIIIYLIMPMKLRTARTEFSAAFAAKVG